MTEPREGLGSDTKYAFWLITDESYLFDFVKTLTCVQGACVKEAEHCLVAIKDEYDADEAWHYIRTALEQEQIIKLDDIWEDALWL